MLNARVCIQGLLKLEMVSQCGLEMIRMTADLLFIKKDIGPLRARSGWMKSWILKIVSGSAISSNLQMM